MVGLVTRNVTSLFLKYRTEHKNKKHRFGSSILGGSYSPNGRGSELSGSQRLLSHVSEDEAEEIELRRHLPPVWVDIVDECREDINRIKEKMSQVQKAQQKRLLKVFHDETDSAPDREMEAATVAITQLFKKCESRLQSIRTTKRADLGTAEYMQRRNAQMSIATQLQSLNQAFRKQQTQYAKEVKRRQKGTDLFEPTTSNSGSGLADGGFCDELIAEVVTSEQDAGQRSEELAKIAQSVAELHSIFKDLSALVIDQGTILDRIDYNIEQVAVQTKQATVQLRKADDRQKSGRAALCIRTLVILIFCLLMILIFKHV